MQYVEATATMPVSLDDVTRAVLLTPGTQPTVTMFDTMQIQIEKELCGEIMPKLVASPAWHASSPTASAGAQEARKLVEGKSPAARVSSLRSLFGRSASSASEGDAVAIASVDSGSHGSGSRTESTLSLPTIEMGM